MKAFFLINPFEFEKKLIISLLIFGFEIQYRYDFVDSAEGSFHAGQEIISLLPCLQIVVFNQIEMKKPLVLNS